MKQYSSVVRRNVPQSLQYTFKKNCTVVIDLSGYVSVSLEVKVVGQAAVTVAGTITDAAAGIVKVDAYTFDTSGVWTAQFFCTDGSGNKLYGEPLQFNVVDNVDNMGLNGTLVS